MKHISAILLSIFILLGYSCKDDLIEPKDEQIEITSGKVLYTEGDSLKYINFQNGEEWGLGNGVWYASISSDGTKIAILGTFGNTAAYNVKIIAISDARTTNPQIISQWDCSCDRIAWMPNSTDLVYYKFNQHIYKNSWQGDREELIFELLIDTTGRESESPTSAIITSPRSEFTLTMHQRIATGPEFWETKRSYGIFVSSGNGGLKLILDRANHNFHPWFSTWIPNSSNIGFIATNEITDDTYIKTISTNGDNLNTIGTFNIQSNVEIIYNLDPSVVWSPDGEQILFTLFTDSTSHIYGADKNGNALTLIRTGAKGSYISNLNWVP
ncbi:MAG: PD40 domain-containing protein [Cyclobacteriaceae bacterium]